MLEALDANFLEMDQVLKRIAALRSTLPKRDDPNTSRESATRKELAVLGKIKRQARRQWPGRVEHGLFVKADYFPVYARELAQSLCAAEAATAWPYTCIDYDKAAQELRKDAASIEVEGVEYLTC